MSREDQGAWMTRGWMGCRFCGATAMGVTLCRASSADEPRVGGGGGGGRWMDCGWIADGSS